MKEGYTPDLVEVNSPLVAPSYSRIDLAPFQKKYLKERDINCQFPFHHFCTGILHLHHVIPQMWAQVQRGEDYPVINYAARILRMCENIHVGQTVTVPEPEMLHPDTRQAKLDYQVDKHAFQDMAERHRRLALEGKEYWYTENDEYLLDIAAFNTRVYERKYQHPYPTGAIINGKIVRR